jgi:hypothetical protein
MIAAGLIVCRHRLRHVEAGDQHDTVAERLERLGGERELEVFSLLERAPVSRRRAVRVPDAGKSPCRRGRRQPQRTQRRHHRFEERQRERHPGPAQERASWNVAVSDEHRYSLVSIGSLAEPRSVSE